MQISNEQELKLKKLAHLVEEKAKVFNITAIRDYDGIWEKHIIDSLKIMECGILSASASYPISKALDIGTGAGFPGLPLAITNPNIQFTLLDSTRKKIDVVNEFIAELDLKNVDAIWSRAEELSENPEYKQGYDLVLGRAVKYLPELLVLTKPFINKNGIIAIYKTFFKEEYDDGIKKAKELGLNLEELYRYQLDGNERVIYLFRGSPGAGATLSKG